MIEKTKKVKWFLHFSLAFCLLFQSAFLDVFSQKALPHLVPAKAFLNKVPAASAYDIAIDSNNLVYTASKVGIHTFNGSELRSVTSRPGFKRPVFVTFFKDARGRLWCRSYSSGFGIVMKDSVIPYEYSDLIKEYDNKAIDDCYQDREGTLHLGIRGKGYFTISKEGVLKHVVDGSLGLLGYVHFTLKDGRPFFFSLSVPLEEQKSRKLHFYHWDGADSFKVITPLKSAQPIYRTASVQRGNGVLSLSIGTNELITFKNDSLVSLIEFPYRIIDLFVDRDQDLWIGTVDHGICRIQNNDFHSYEHYLGDAPAAVVAQDEGGGLWVQCSEDFFYYIPFLERRSFVQDVPALANLESGFSVTDGSRVFVISQSDQLIILSGDSIRYVPIPRASMPMPGKPKNMSYPLSIHYDSVRNWVWLGMWGRLEAFDGQSWHSYKVPELSIIDEPSVLGINNMPDGSILANLKYGLIHIKDDKVHYIEQKQEEKTGRIRQALVDSCGTVWLGCYDGVWQWKDNEFKRYAPESPFADSLERLTMYLAEGLGRVWIQVLRGKLYYVDGSDLKQMLNSSGETMILRELETGPDGDLWGRPHESDAQLVRISADQGKVKAKEYNSNLFFESADYTFSGGLSVTNTDLLFVAGRTLYSIPLDNLDFSPQQPTVVMDELFINHEPTTLKSNYDLLPFENTLQLSFLPIYYGLERLVFRHRLVGLSEHWQESDHPYVQYTNLDAGDYQFELEIKSVKSDWGKGPTIHFHVQKPFWQTWWFILLTVLASIAFIGLGFYLWFRIRERRAQLVIEKLMAEQRTLRSQMNPHFLFNALVSLQDMVFKKERMDAVSNISMFATLMRKILAQSLEDVITLEEEIAMLTLYLQLEALRFEDRFHFEINVEDGIDPASQLLPPMLLQPFVENAIKHGLQNKKSSGGEVRVSFSTQGNGLLCIVEDNGIGRAQASAMKAISSHKSFSLGAIKERIALLNLQMDQEIALNIIDQDRNGIKGTRIELYLP